MPSALDRFASLTLKLTVPGTPAVSDVDGVLEATGSEVIGLCWVRPGSGRAMPADANVFTEIPLSGYFLSPQRPSADSVPGTSVEAILWRLTSDFTLLAPGTSSLRSWRSHAAYDAFVEANRANIDHEGTFTIQPTLASQYVLPDTLLGKALSGVFSSRAVWGNIL